MNFQIIRVDLQKKYKTNVVKKKDLLNLQTRTHAHNSTESR